MTHELRPTNRNVAHCLRHISQTGGGKSLDVKSKEICDAPGGNDSTKTLVLDGENEKVRPARGVGERDERVRGAEIELEKKPEQPGPSPPDQRLTLLLTL